MIKTGALRIWPIVPVPPAIVSDDLSEESQHEFLNDAKDFEFARVRRWISHDQRYVNAQPRTKPVRFTALHQACLFGDAGMVKFLLDNHANPTMTVYNDATPKYVALFEGKRTHPEYSDDYDQCAELIDKSLLQTELQQASSSVGSECLAHFQRELQWLVLSRPEQDRKSVV